MADEYPPDIDPEVNFFHLYGQAALEFAINADVAITTDDPYDEDRYCHFCGNGDWKLHASWCLWDHRQDMIKETRDG